MNNKVTDDLNDQLRALLDKESIRELVQAYCNAADRHDHEKMRSLYHEDAIDDHGAFFHGAAMDFIDKLPDIQATMRILHHNVTTHNIKLDGHKAEGEVYVLAFHQAEGGQGLFDVLIGGRYLDKYEKRDGVWKFSHRAVLADWVNIQEQTVVKLEHPFIAGSNIGRPGLDDPSYRFFEMFRRGKR
ncbi:nuclear transport factor 2 family protein [Endozoicomonas elysicola]|uniref:SnoaL-like domain-containing protein n=1 Tax=Endozoicomonas elysicola TaxID=305900 RepID=A0A081KF94_9GAMM|nr:nuclear transport factor 2 family protein [Endozoicomonas elysicola]KEI72820.1 hypothetical protein GV64_20710 [Endozoicomonas elysicola]